MPRLTLALVLAAATTAAAQRPNFSGQWAFDDTTARPAVARTGDAAFRRGDMGSGWGSPVTITQRADSLIVEYVFFSTYDLQPPIRLAYAADGSESRNTVMLSHSNTVQRSRIAWRGDTLVITTLHPLDTSVDRRGGTVEVRQALSLASPNALTIETTRAGILGASPTKTTTLLHKR